MFSDYLLYTFIHDTFLYTGPLRTNYTKQKEQELISHFVSLQTKLKQHTILRLLEAP